MGGSWGFLIFACNFPGAGFVARLAVAASNSVVWAAVFWASDFEGFGVLLCIARAGGDIFLRPHAGGGVCLVACFALFFSFLWARRMCLFSYLQVCNAVCVRTWVLGKGFFPRYWRSKDSIAKEASLGCWGFSFYTVGRVGFRGSQGHRSSCCFGPAHWEVGNIETYIS